MKYTIICLISFMLAAMAGQTALAKEVKVDGSILGENSHSQAKQQVLSSDLIAMYGAKDSTELTYQIPAGSSSAQQQLAIEYEASDLLIPPSSLTAEIDGEPVKTVKLDGDSKRKTLKLSLDKSQSSQGYHSLSLKFYGVLKEGVCVRQDSSGNWIKIYPDSRLTLGDNSGLKGTALEHYPYPFAQSGNTEEEAAIVIPDDPSSAEIEAAVKTESYLHTVDSSIRTKLLNESDVKRIDRPTMFIGVQQHWNGKVKKLLKQGNLKAHGEKLLLAERVLKANDRQQPVLFVTAASDDVLTDKISVITDKTYSSQLSGETLEIGKLIHHTNQSGHDLTLENFGAGDLTIGSDQTSSEHYYYPVPAILDKNQPAKLSLALKKSASIQKAAAESEASAKDAELKVMINGQPHSIDLEDLGKEDKNGFYHVSLKVDPKLLQKNRYIDIQFVTSGLKENNPCSSTDDDKWVFIDKNSTLSYSVGDTSATADFQDWPLPYAGDQNNTTLMILPDRVDQSKLHELSLVTDSFGSEAQQSFTVKKASEVKANDAKGRNIIFIGAVNEFSLLKEKAADLAVQVAKNGALDVSAFQMLNETTKRVAFTQASLWDSNYSMAVFAPLSGQGTAVTKEMISFLNSNSDTATVMNETDSRQVFTNHQQLISKTSGTQPAETEKGNQQHMLLYVGILVFIMAIAVISIWIAVRRKKRKTDRG
ncbi:cellulose biosynthesis cyclic di-GMP-binding regulatory protein BcsB [Bacillus sonorensis]|uniref:cellulose biosynthesis cyclic di-GMP-binding regulatory protein BcsB n=1 Tax=Bacillus sonorensis TaxID=119858 RepID=UPI0004985EFD|nr:cellulose biosynthesis cyclic di-GMP-binding regulatory protein BcsB [Bacillus sonorensis]MCY7858108.1 cellulose biosynthesis cyclic di-GMP-binding regulatory protein BcsB [Bacillus sonorensis]MCZ0068106.1 cellulose biosynthesis cyclic di-GMP-binding regulatory protein BcsB [Bacillus sonorensis]MCZ0094501.1 cellulose biosynthesis cyclic di-GMP-binding regulatory protein BcsB [Bacillus sonorensis]MEC1519457.1 cellulose biosynthesis cyclic di-GMP-binding regulatory protein BcsB [Bacillus sonor